MGRPAKRLVVREFQCRVAGYEFGGIECRETAWNIYAEMLGPESARLVLSGLQFWVRTLRYSAVRDVSCFLHCCKRLSLDDCMALTDADQVLIPTPLDVADSIASHRPENLPSRQSRY